MMNKECSAELELFYKLIKAEFGLDFQGKDEATLIKSINNRMQANCLDKLHDYYQRLNNDNKELQELVSLLTINETYFYREEKHLKLLTDSIIPKLQAENSANNPIRILSIGCSTGAEPYSIAMALDQKYGPVSANLFTILGVDVDYRALDAARTARYTSMAFRSLDDNLKQYYFKQEPSQYGPKIFVLNPEIQKMVSFQYMNIISDYIDPALKNFDVIFFRNVSIYFDRTSLLSIHKKFVSMLKPNAFLLVGLTESLSNNFGLLNLKNEQGVFYFQKQDSNQPLPAESVVKRINSLQADKILFKRPKTSIAITKNTSTDDSIDNYKDIEKNTNSIVNINDLVQQKNYDKALLLLKDLSSYHGDEKAKYLLLRAFILFNRQEFENAHSDALQVLDLSPFSVDVFLLLGMISKWQKQTDKAISWFKKALYIYSNCWPAHYYLAGLYFEQGSLHKAAQEYRLVLQQLEHPEEDFLALMSIPLSLPKTEIRLLCQSHLNNLARKISYTGMEKRFGN